MGIMKKKKQNKKIKFDDDGEVQDDGYDIEASDDEIDDVPSKWYDEFPYEKLPKIPYDEKLLESLRNEAEMVLEEETKSFKIFLSESKKSETKWMMTMAKSGTSSDKVAALALMVQESPIHNTAALSSLVNMAKVSKKHQFVIVLETLSELFISDLLRPTKKLRKFSKQPLAHLPDLCKDVKARRKRLCYWLFEDKLKTLYEQFIKLLNEATHDSVQNNREKAVGVMLKLLQSNREQEQLLISNLINKFGDPVHKVASRVVYGLEKVVAKYPKKKEDILEEVERMLFRPHISKRAQYYGICFLSQYKLSGSEKELSRRLIVLYFSFFKACVKTGDIDSRLMGALLVGVNRAYPYASRGKSSEPVIPPEHIDTMYKVVHLAPFKISLQALALLLQISNNDRFYNALYKKLFDKELIHTSHQAIWLNLMMKAIRKDDNDSRKKSFVKRILQVCLYFPVPLICGTLVMMSQLLKQIPDSKENLQFFDENEIKEEQDVEENELLSNLKRFEDNDEDEKYEDVKTEEELAEASSTQPQPSTSVPSSWFHRTLLAPKIDHPVPEKKHKDPVTFDPLHRNPAFAGGQRCTLVELYALSKHFHPTVSLFARKIINGERIHYTGDPLKDFTTLHFLERFSFKNPKKSKHDRGEEKEELFRAVGSQRKHYNPTGMKALPVQSDLYLNQAESAIPVDELFLYRYLKEKRIHQEKDKKNKADDDSDLSDAESVDSVEFNEYLDGLMTGKKAAQTLDFAEDVETTKNTKKTKNKDGKESSSDEESEDDEDQLDIDEDDQSIGDDGEGNEEGDEDDEDDEDVEDEESISDFDSQVDENEDDVDIDDISDDGDEDEMKLPLQSALKKRITRDFGSMAVPTEKFSEMLEEAGRSKSGGSHDIFNRDNASEKQMKWESKRMKQNWKSKKNFNKRKNDQPRWKKNKKIKK